MATNFKPWIDNAIAGQHVQASSVFAEDLQRINGFIAGDLASALRVNSALRQSNLVVTALMEMCDGVIPLSNDLSLLSSVEDVKNAIYDSIRNINNDKTFVNVYKSISDFPSFTTSNTINELCGAMTDNSYLNIDTSGYANLCPSGEADSNGQLEIVKANANRVRLMWSYRNASTQPVYLATYNTVDGFSGWKQIFTTDRISTVMPTSGTKSDLKVPSEALFYDKLALKANLQSPNFTGAITRTDYPLGTYQMTARSSSTNYSNVMSLRARYGTGTESRFNIELGITITGPTLSTPLSSKLKLHFLYNGYGYANLQYTAEASELKEELGTFFIAMYNYGTVDIYYKTNSNFTLATATILGTSGDFNMLPITFTPGSSSYDPDVTNGSSTKIQYTDYALNVPTSNDFTNDDKSMLDKFANSLSTTTLFKSDTGVGGSWTYGNYVWTTILSGVDIRGKKLLIYSGFGINTTTNDQRADIIVIPKTSSIYTLFTEDYISTEDGLMSKTHIVLRYTFSDGLQMSSKPRYVKVDTTTGLFVDDTTTHPDAHQQRYVYAIYQIND